MTSYDTIFKRFLHKITDYQMLDANDTDVRADMTSWLSGAVARFRRCENDLSQRDDEIQTFLIDLNENEIEILALLMVSQWLEPQLNSELYTSQFFGGKEEKLWQYCPRFAAYGNGAVYSFEYAGTSLCRKAETKR